MHRINFPLISFIVGILTISGLLMVNYYLENAMGMDPDDANSTITTTPAITNTLTPLPNTTNSPNPTLTGPLLTQSLALTITPGPTNSLTPTIKTPTPSTKAPTPTTKPRVTQPPQPTTTPGAQNVQVIVSFLPSGSYLLCPQSTMTAINTIITQTEAALIPVDSAHTTCLAPLETALQNCITACPIPTCMLGCEQIYTPQLDACDNTYDAQRAAIVGPATSQLKSYCTYFDPPPPLY